MDPTGLLKLADLLMTTVLWLIAVAGVLLAWKTGVLAELGIALLIVAYGAGWLVHRGR